MSAGVAVRNLDGVDDGDALVGGEVVEDSGTGREDGVEGAGGIAAGLGDVAEGQQAEQGRGIQAGGDGAGGRDARDGGAVADVAEVDVGEREAGRGDERGGAGLLREADVAVGDVEDEVVVRAGDGDRHGLGVDIGAVRDLDGVLDGDRLADGEVVEDGGGGAEGQADGARRVAGVLGDRGGGDQA